MKLSTSTMALLKHYSGINPGIIFEDGNRLHCCNISKTCRSTALIAESLPSFAIANLAQFLNVINMFDNPELEFDESSVTIVSADGKNRMRYTFSDPRLVDNEHRPLKIEPDVDVELELKAEDLQSINKSAAILGTDDIAIYAKNGEIFIGCMNKSVNNSPSYEIFLTKTDKADFITYFKKTDMKLSDNSFKVVIGHKGDQYLSIWTATDSVLDNLVYFIALQNDSKFPS